MDNKEMSYRIPQSQLFRLLEVCANTNHCTPNHKAHCKCRKKIPNLEDKDNYITLP